MKNLQLIKKSIFKKSTLNILARKFFDLEKHEYYICAMLFQWGGGGGVRERLMVYNYITAASEDVVKQTKQL